MASKTCKAYIITDNTLTLLYGRSVYYALGMADVLIKVITTVIECGYCYDKALG